jgi:hypothetical protein
MVIKRNGKYTSQKNNSIENSVGSEENEYPVSDPPTKQ